MREILFKAKNINNGEWVEGDRHYNKMMNKMFILLGDINTFPCGECGGRTDEFAAVEVNQKTVSQFTGLTDKNGVKIFEGDELICGNDSFTGVVYFNNKKCGFYIKWYNNKERASKNKDITIPEFIKKRELATNGKCIIIGNIHDQEEK